MVVRGDPSSVRQIVTTYTTSSSGMGVSDQGRSPALQRVWPDCAGDAVAHIRQNWHTPRTWFRRQLAHGRLISVSIRHRLLYY